MPQKNPNNPGAQSLFALSVIANVVVLKYAYTNSASLYWLLLITGPLLLFSRRLARQSRQQEPRQKRQSPH